MPYNPGVVDRSGEIFAQGIQSGFGHVANLLQFLAQRAAEKEEYRTALAGPRPPRLGQPGSESNPGLLDLATLGAPEGPKEGTGEGGASEADKAKWKVTRAMRDIGIHGYGLPREQVDTMSTSELRGTLRGLELQSAQEERAQRALLAQSTLANAATNRQYQMAQIAGLERQAEADRQAQAFNEYLGGAGEPPAPPPSADYLNSFLHEGLRAQPGPPAADRTAADPLEAMRRRLPGALARHGAGVDPERVTRLLEVLSRQGDAANRFPIAELGQVKPSAIPGVAFMPTSVSGGQVVYDPRQAPTGGLEVETDAEGNPIYFTVDPRSGHRTQVRTPNPAANRKLDAQTRATLENTLRVYRDDLRAWHGQEKRSKTDKRVPAPDPAELRSLQAAERRIEAQLNELGGDESPAQDGGAVEQLVDPQGNTVEAPDNQVESLLRKGYTRPGAPAPPIIARPPRATRGSGFQNEPAVFQPSAPAPLYRYP